MAIATEQRPTTEGGGFESQPERPTDDLIRLEEVEVVAARAEETLTVDLTAEPLVVRRVDFTIRPAAGLRERVRRARFYFGLLGLFVVYLTMSLALVVVALAIGLGWTSAVLTSGSMSPLIRAGDVVVASPDNGRGLGPGTVVVFSDPARSGLLTHRIESVNPDGSYVTYGDANRQPDSTPLRPEQVVGVGRLLVPFIGFPMTWYWAGAWGKLALWATGTLLALWLARYAFLPKSGPPAREESGHVRG